MLWALKVEKEHARILKKALKALKSGVDFPHNLMFLCQVCGNLVLGDLNGKGCAVCGHDLQFFNQVTGEK
jgi:rubrerythrin